MLDPSLMKSFDASFAFIETLALLFFLTNIVTGHIDRITVVMIVWCSIATSLYLTFRGRLRLQ
ncbi:hypothetical protein [[Eubacterium] cellulosolvens]